MNILRAFADMDPSQGPRLKRLVRYDGMDVDGASWEGRCATSASRPVSLWSPGSALGGNRVGCFRSRGGGDGGDDGGGGGLQVLLGCGRQVVAARLGWGDGRAGKAGSDLDNDLDPGTPQRGKGGEVYLPASDSAVRTYDEVVGLACRAEIQSLKVVRATSGGYDGGRCRHKVLVTDTFGRGVCGTVVPAMGSAGTEAQTCHLELAHVYPLAPDDSVVAAEGGLTAGAVSGATDLAVIVRHFPKDVSVFDGDRLVRTFHTLGNPNAVELVDDHAVVAVAEGSMVSVYDVRISDRQARVARMQPGGSTSNGHYHALAVRDGRGGGNGGNGGSGHAACPLVGAGGEDRDVVVWDPRTWGSVSRWKNCLKYEINYVGFLDSDPRYCVVSGMDYEVACGAWFENTSQAFKASVGEAKGNSGTNSGTNSRKGRGRATGPVGETGSVAEAQRQSRVVASYRGTSRWIGMSKLEGSDIFVGVTSDGVVYHSEF